MAEGSPNPNANMLRNIIVGVATSVLGAGSLYYLGINKSGQSGASSQGSFLEMKEATTKGWKSYVTDDNIYYKNSQSVYNDYYRDKQMENLKENLLKEAHKFQDDLGTILKDQNLDNTFISMIKRRQEAEKEAEAKMTGFLDNINSLLKDNSIGAYDKQQKIIQENQKLASVAKGMYERSATELEGLSKALNEKYGQSFDPNDIIPYKEYKNGTFATNNNAANTNTLSTSNQQQQDNGIKSAANVPPEPSNTSNNAANNTTNQLSAGMYAGEWTNEGGSLYFDNKGFSWEWNDGKVTSEGSWRVDNYRLAMYVTNGYNTGYSWTFNLSNVTANSFTMQLSNNSSYTYHMVKYTGQ